MASTRLFTVLFKNEVTPGVDPVPTPAANGILVSDLVINPVGELHERILNNASFSQFAHVIGTKWHEVSFSVELKGSGTANAGGIGDVPEIDSLLRSTGFARTLTAESGGGVGDGKVEYDPASTNLETGTLYGYKDGKLHKMHYCFVNSFQFTAEAGKPGKIDMSLIGTYNRPTDIATPVGIVFNNTRPPLFKNANLSIDGWAPEFEKLSIEAGLNIAKRLDANHAQALKGFELTGRVINGSVDPVQVAESAHPFHQNWEEAKEMAFTGDIGETAGNIIQITGPAVQYKSLTDGNREELATYDIPLTFARQNGDDEIKFIFK